MAERRVWLVGEHNPHGADPRLALFPRPPNGAGGRLRRLLGMTEREYLRAFERRNLLSELPWRAEDAREAAEGVLSEVRGGDAVVLLGVRVARAFGYAFEPFRAHVRPLRRRALGQVSVLVLPHPSGRCRIYNDAEAVRLARAAVAEIRERKVSHSAGPAGPAGAEP